MGVVFTSRISYRGPERLDITVKSGTGLGRILAPTWDMVLGVKAGYGDQRWQEKAVQPMTETAYTERYYALLRKRYRENPDGFIELLRRDRVVLCCYCRADAFCHRHLAVDILEKIAQAKGIPFIRGGELSIVTKV